MSRWRMAAARSSRPAAGLSAAVAVVLWGAWFPLTKLAVGDDLGELDIALVRFATAGVIAVPILMRHGFLAPGKRGLLKAVALSQAAGVGYVLVAALALRFASGTYGMATPVSVAMFTALFGLALGTKRINGFVCASFAADLAGLAALLAFRREDATAPNPALGLGLFIVAGFLFSLYNVFVARWKLQALHATALVSFYSAVAVVPVYAVAVALSGPRPMPWAGQILFQMAYQGVLVSYVALMLFTSAIQKLGAARAAYLVLAVPAIAAGLSMVLLGDRAEPAVLLAAALLIAGMGLGIIGARRPTTVRRAATVDALPPPPASPR